MNKEIVEFLTAQLKADLIGIGLWTDDAVIQVPGIGSVVDRAFSKDHLLADITARLRILQELLPDIEAADRLIEGEWGDSDDLADRLLRLFASVYAAHPDYREEWAI